MRIASFTSQTAWFRPWFHLVPLGFATSDCQCLIANGLASALEGNQLRRAWFHVPRLLLVSINRRWGGTAVSPEIHRKGLGSSLGSTWFRHGSTQRSLTESHVFKAVCLGVGLGSTWFPAVAPQTSWFRPWFHVVLIWF